ncbi:DUF4865 family protein [Aquabacterium sp.]|uniref:DUF4865 family protein n=1 Tax=Aquabacterium sp. TaxID=1872578 RepID=UPI0037843B7F
MYMLHYAFDLPPSFDMGVIRRRISDKRHLFERHDGLVWKAWLLADSAHATTPDNCYAPVYLFEHASAARDFLLGPLYAAVTQTFGWVRPTAGPLLGTARPRLHGARSCTLDIVDVPSHAALVAHGERPVPAAEGLLAQASMFDVSRMQVRQFRFWDRDAALLGRAAGGSTVFEVGAISAVEPLPT